MTLPIPVLFSYLGPEAGLGQNPGLLVTQSGPSLGWRDKMTGFLLEDLVSSLGSRKGFPSYQGLSHIVEEMWQGS